jgi:hypothetical protein
VKNDPVGFDCAALGPRGQASRIFKNVIVAKAFTPLFRISIADERITPFWLLPVGKKVMLASGDVL